MTGPTLAVIADVAGSMDYHLGDEAMIEANLWSLRQLVPRIRFTVFSRDPPSTAARHRVDAVKPPRSQADLSPAAVDAIRSSAGLLISGGGNFRETWPDRVNERATLIELARDCDKPVVMVGQTIGPELSPAQVERLSSVFPETAWLGVRDDSSGALAERLGLPSSRIHRQLDDAFFLGTEPVTDERIRDLDLDRRPLILITLDASLGNPAGRDTLAALAHQLESLSQLMDATLVFVPHVGGDAVEAARDDRVAGQALSGLLKTPIRLLGLWQPMEVRWLVGRATMVISSRYHPIVFATAAGVPSLAIYQDEYTRIKLRGALSPAGLENWCLSISDAERGALLSLAAEAHHRQPEIQSTLAALRIDSWPREASRWQEVCECFHLAPFATLSSRPTAPYTPMPRKGSRTMTGTLTEEQWLQFERDGYLLLGRIMDDAQLAALQQRIDDIMLGHVRYASVQSQLDTGGRYEDLPDPVSGVHQPTLAYRKLQGLESDALILDLLRHDLFRETAARLYGRHASISIFRAMLMNKPAGQGTHLPWHQDAGDVWKLDRDPILTSWVALDPATRANGCVQVIPGSHQLGLLSKYGSTISEAHAAQYCHEDQIVFLELQAGEAMILHNWLLHRSGVNSTTQPRRAFSACYMDGRTLNTVNGTRFPIVFGEHEDLETALPFMRPFTRDLRHLADTAEEASRYAKSLLAANDQLENMRRETERYARSLEDELARVRAAPAARPPAGGIGLRSTARMLMNALTNRRRH